jgi:hypothetical protein
MTWISFGALPCRGKKKNLISRVSMLKLRVSPDTLPFSLCNKKILAIRHVNRALFPTTLLLPSYDNRKVGLRTYPHPLVYTVVNMLCNYLYYFYIVHSAHYDIFKLGYLQWMHNSTIDVSFLSFSSYMFWHCHPQGAYTNISLKHTVICNLQ